MIHRLKGSTQDGAMSRQTQQTTVRVQATPTPGSDSAPLDREVLVGLLATLSHQCQQQAARHQQTLTLLQSTTHDRDRLRSAVDSLEATLRQRADAVGAAKLQYDELAERLRRQGEEQRRIQNACQAELQEARAAADRTRELADRTTSTLAALNRERAAEAAALADAQAAARQATGDREALQARVAELTRTLDELREQAQTRQQELAGRLTDLQNASGQSRNEVELLRAALDAKNHEHAEAIQAAATREAGLREALRRLQDHAQTDGPALQQAQAELEAARARERSLGAEAERQRAHAEELTAELHTERARQEAAAREHAEWEQELRQRVDGFIAEYEAREQDLRRQLAAQEAATAAAERHESAPARIQHFQEAAETAVRTLRETQRRLEVSEEQLRTLREEAARGEQGLLHQVERLKSELQSATQQLAASRHRQEQQDEELRSLRTSHSHYGRLVAAGGDDAPPSSPGNPGFRRALEGAAPSAPEFGGQNENSSPASYSGGDEAWALTSHCPRWNPDPLTASPKATRSSNWMIRNRPIWAPGK
jgi:chromosome segregation ATPase